MSRKSYKTSASEPDFTKCVDSMNRFLFLGATGVPEFRLYRFCLLCETDIGDPLHFTFGTHISLCMGRLDALVRKTHSETVPSKKVADFISLAVRKFWNRH